MGEITAWYKEYEVIFYEDKRHVFTTDAGIRTILKFDIADINLVVMILTDSMAKSHLKVCEMLDDYRRDNHV